MYHSCSELKNAPVYQEDMRLFSYIWPHVRIRSGSRTVGVTDGMAWENGDQVYRESIHVHTCCDIYKERPICIDCCRHDTVVDLRGIGLNSYSHGDRSIGDLDELGWIVARGVRIDEPTYKDIKGVICMCRTV